MTDGRAYLNWHGRQLGLLGVGYHMLFARYGEVHVCRPVEVVGSHAPGLNHHSIGLCLIGGEDDSGVPADNFTDQQMVSLHVWVRKLLRWYPSAKVVGHSEVHKVSYVRDGDRTRRTCPMLDMDKFRRDIKEAE